MGTPGLLMLLEIAFCAIGVGCAADAFNLEVDWQAYIFSAVCISLIISTVLFLMTLFNKLSDDRMLLGGLFLCAILMIIAVVIIGVKFKWFSVGNVAIVAIILAMVILILQILTKLG